MIFTENSFVYTGGNVRGQNITASRRDEYSPVSGERDFLGNMEKAAEKVKEKP